LIQAPIAPTSALQLVLVSSVETKVVLAITAVFSLASWFIIGLKWWQFRRIRRSSNRFFQSLEQNAKIYDAYRAAMKQPSTPHNRLFREAMAFYNDIQPGALREAGATKTLLAPSQLEAFKMVLGKEISAERDIAARWVPWLATIGSVSPLLGLLGTVLGVMDAFIGISTHGSGNISAVAPGVAEALVTTVAGLAAAIPAVMAYNYFANRVGLFESELEGFAYELIGWMAREGMV
jgi:biopolymer transport protein TolQ